MTSLTYTIWGCEGTHPHTARVGLDLGTRHEPQSPGIQALRRIKRSPRKPCALWPNTGAQAVAEVMKGVEDKKRRGGQTALYVNVAILSSAVLLFVVSLNLIRRDKPCVVLQTNPGIRVAASACPPCAQAAAAEVQAKTAAVPTPDSELEVPIPRAHRSVIHYFDGSAVVT